MSRLAKKLITIPEEVSIVQNGDSIIIKSANATLEHKLHFKALIKVEDNRLVVLRKDDSKLARAIQGTTYVLINNHIIGVTKGFKKTLQLHGVGYKAKVEGNELRLEVGQSKSHVIIFIIPSGIKVEVHATAASNVTEIIVSGNDKQLVGQAAANIRSIKKPERYKGKGIRYLNEIIQLKETKKTKK